MGGWKLEVARMAMYMAFPVAIFHYFNQPEYFEDWVKSTRRELFPPENSTHKEELALAILQMQQAHDVESLRALDKNG